MTTPEPLSTASLIDTEGIGPVKLGMSTAQVRRATGSRLTYSGPGEGFCSAFSASGLSMLLPTSPAPARLERIDVLPDGTFSTLRTTTGIHLGSSLAALKHAYPNAVVQNGTESDATPFYRVDGKEGALDFSVEAGVVNSIGVQGKASLIGGAELCG